MGREQWSNALIQASWDSIFAGGVTAMALSILMAILGLALGFAVVKQNPEQSSLGLGMTFGGWSVLSMIVSIACGALIVGMFADSLGMQHGFMLWALVMLTAPVIGGLAVGGALRAVSALLKDIGAGTAGASAQTGHSTAHGVTALMEELTASVQTHVDADKLTEDAKAVLIDTSVASLHPDHLKGQRREIRAELRTTLHHLLRSPDDAEKIISDFLTAQKMRLDAIGTNIDRDTAVLTVMRVRHISHEEAETLVDDAITSVTHVRNSTKEALHNEKDTM